jgi:hypothetical protein
LPVRFDGPVKSPSAAYFYVRLIPQDSRALHLALFTVPSDFATFYELIRFASDVSLFWLVAETHALWASSCLLAMPENFC